jgi:hypothetical protein
MVSAKDHRIIHLISDGTACGTETFIVAKPLDGTDFAMLAERSSTVSLLDGSGPLNNISRLFCFLSRN